ncbi:hypothetical protein [Nocardia sp. NPDC127526]|uniref:hypothetical protein n=1 Tax=Nocardia sp. NPDC127526 TaxID=3345393 RepID=UPI00363A52D1
MKRISAIAGTVLACATIAGLASGCGSNDGTTTAATSSTTTSAPVAYTWDTFRTKYNDFLIADCKGKEGDPWVQCYNWQAGQARSMLTDIQQLPMNKQRADTEQAINALIASHTAMNGYGCLNWGGMSNLGCSVSKLTSEAGATGLQTFIRLGAA